MNSYWIVVLLSRAGSYPDLLSTNVDEVALAVTLMLHC
jgi:hypothetical protein